MSYPEVQRNHSIFTVILSIVALEMVMAEDARARLAVLPVRRVSLTFLFLLFSGPF